MIFTSLRCFNHVGKKTEVITKGKKGIFMNFKFALRIKIRENPSVLPQQTMNVPNEVIRFAVKPVVVIVTALVRTELFIGAATYRIAAIETFLFHSTNVSIKI